jgi:hypothetical protein
MRAAPARRPNRHQAMIDWLLTNFEFFGLNGQNWMLAFAGAFAVYIAVLVITRQIPTR